MDESELLQRLQRLSDVNPDAAATERALDKTRAALANAGPAPRSRQRRMWAHYLAYAAALSVLAIIGGWIVAPARLAFADVKDKVEKTRSVTIKATTTVDGKSTSERTIIMADGRVRMEDADGSYSVIDPKTERSLAVNLKNKTALLIRGYYNRMPTNIYQIIRDIRKDEVRKLPAEKIDGKATEVFIAKFKMAELEQELKVWVDPKSELPLRLEMTYKVGLKQPEQRAVMDLVFDQPVDEKLFSTEPPEGYKLRDEGVKEPPTEEVKPVVLQVLPKEGIGPIKFGMTQQEVIDKIGKPDKIDQRGGAMDYLSRGYSIMVRPKRGVVAIICYSQAAFAVKVKDFAGKTKDGIGIGSSAADIKKAYGEPDAAETEEATIRLNYSKKLGMEFTLFSDKLVQFSISQVP
jgi:outer membrane lipoprotein-sorting protein